VCDHGGNDLFPNVLHKSDIVPVDVIGDCPKHVITIILILLWDTVQ
jgi:hypothetical protein